MTGCAVAKGMTLCIDSVDLDEGTPDHVLGGFGNDILFVDEGDLVEVGRGLDEVFVDLGGGIAEGYDPVTIPDFTPRVDKVDVLGFDADDVSVADLEDGTGAGDALDVDCSVCAKFDTGLRINIGFRM